MRYILLIFLAVTITSQAQIQMEPLSWNPRIFVFHHFLSEEECDHLRNLAANYLQRSTVIDLNSSRDVYNNDRTSYGAFLPQNLNDPIVSAIEARISAVTLIPKENGESIQVLYYSVGGEYKPHHDYFDENTVGGAQHASRGGQRVASFLMYLNTPEGGGETIFPRLNIKVKPQKGDALLFFDCRLDGKVDPNTFHGGAPVTRGEKWLATKWLRQGIFR